MTHLLYDSFGGNCLTTVIVQLFDSVEKTMASETVQMLRGIMDFAMLMSTIKNFPLVNEDVVFGLITRHRVSVIVDG